MSTDCHMGSKVLATYAVGGLSERRRHRVRTHVASCARCRRRLAAADDLLGAARGLAEDLSPTVRHEQIQRALAALPARLRRGRLVLATAVLLAATAIAARAWWSAPGGDKGPADATVLQAGRVVAPSVTLRAGDALTVGVPLKVATGDSVVARLPDGSIVTAAAASVLVLGDGRGTHWRVETGTLHFSVRPRPEAEPLFVATEEATVRVVGTQFSVARDLNERTTLIAVQEGVVEVVAHADGHRTQLGQGQSLLVGGRRATVDGGAKPAGKPAEPPVARPKAPVSPVIAAIRDKILAGELPAARSLIRAVRQRKLDAETRAEIGLVEAEADLAEGRYAGAIDRYLAVGERDPHSAQAEAGLFAAAQLAVDHPSKEHDGRALLGRYLEQYPAGRFALEVRLLVRAIEGQR